MRELLERLELEPRRLGPFGAIGAVISSAAKRVAPIVDHHEAPRRELAVIGRARGDLEDLRELRLRRGRGRPDRAACPSGGWRAAVSGVERSLSIAAT